MVFQQQGAIAGTWLPDAQNFTDIAGELLLDDHEFPLMQKMLPPGWKLVPMDDGDESSEASPAAAGRTGRTPGRPGRGRGRPAREPQGGRRSARQQERAPPPPPPQSRRRVERAPPPRPVAPEPPKRPRRAPAIDTVALKAQLKENVEKLTELQVEKVINFAKDDLTDNTGDGNDYSLELDALTPERLQALAHFVDNELSRGPEPEDPEYALFFEQLGRAPPQVPRVAAADVPDIEDVAAAEAAEASKVLAEEASKVAAMERAAEDLISDGPRKPLLSPDFPAVDHGDSPLPDLDEAATRTQETGTPAAGTPAAGTPQAAGTLSGQSTPVHSHSSAQPPSRRSTVWEVCSAQERQKNDHLREVEEKVSGGGTPKAATPVTPQSRERPADESHQGQGPPAQALAQTTSEPPAGQGHTAAAKEPDFPDVVTAPVMVPKDGDSMLDNCQEILSMVDDLM